MPDMWAKRVEEQNEDLKTKSDKGVNVEMTEKEYSNMTSLALKVGFKSVSQLLESFVGDLTGWHTNGSDESDLADQWYDRAFGIWSETYDYFRHYIYNYDIDIDAAAEDEDYFEDVYNEYLEDYKDKDHDTKEECLAIIKELYEEGENNVSRK